MKTTQPRRYLVRPNQGLIAPGGTEVVQILLVEKDAKQLVASFQTLGMAALEHCKDKFLVQSVAVSNSQTAKELAEYEQLTAFWAAAASNATLAIVNKKLHVRHEIIGVEADIGVSGGANNAASTSAGGSSSLSSVAPSAMTKEQLVPELTGLRRKYDELVAFSVNLTAERDMLSNTLEQTKRDLNRAVTARANAGAANAVASNKALAGRAAARRSGSAMRTVFLLVWTVACLGLGLWMQPLVAQYEPQMSLAWELLGLTPTVPRRPPPSRVLHKDKEL